EWRGYEDTLDRVFGTGVDYGTVHKHYASVAAGRGRYAPPKVSSVTRTARKGHPDQSSINTATVERNNLTIRTMQRRFTRLELGASKVATQTHLTRVVLQKSTRHLRAELCPPRERRTRHVEEDGDHSPLLGDGPDRDAAVREHASDHDRERARQAVGFTAGGL